MMKATHRRRRGKLSFHPQTHACTPTNALPRPRCTKSKPRREADGSDRAVGGATLITSTSPTLAATCSFRRITFPLSLERSSLASPRLASPDRSSRSLLVCQQQTGDKGCQHVIRRVYKDGSTGHPNDMPVLFGTYACLIVFCFRSSALIIMLLSAPAIW
jgi:hypothetical protein